MAIFLLKNTVNDRNKTTQHRSAAGLTEVISIGGVRLDPGMQMYIESEHFERIRDQLVKHYQDGALEVLEMDVKEGTELRMLAPERIPTPQSNPHGEYNPQLLATPSPVAVPTGNETPVKMMEKPIPGVPPLPNPVPGSDLADPNAIQPTTAEVAAATATGAVVPRPLVEQAILPNEVVPREAHLAVPGEAGPGTQAIESVKEVSGPDAPATAPPLTPPKDAEPRQPESAGGAGTPETENPNAPSQSDEPPAKAKDPGPGSPHTHPPATTKKKRLM